MLLLVVLLSLLLLFNSVAPLLSTTALSINLTVTAKSIVVAGSVATQSMHLQGNAASTAVDMVG